MGDLTITDKVEVIFSFFQNILFMPISAKNPHFILASMTFIYVTDATFFVTKSTESTIITSSPLKGVTTT